MILAAGAWMGRLLRQAGIDLPMVHTHAEIVESEPLPPTFKHVVIAMKPVEQSRGTLETAIAQPERRARFEAEDGSDLGLAPSVEIGVVQQADGRVRLGQLSRAISGFLDGPHPDGEAAIRAEVGRYFPELAQQPGQIHHRPVSFSAGPPAAGRAGAGRAGLLAGQRAGQPADLPAGPGASDGRRPGRRARAGAVAVLASPAR